MLAGLVNIAAWFDHVHLRTDCEKTDRRTHKQLVSFDFVTLLDMHLPSEVTVCNLLLPLCACIIHLHLHLRGTHCQQAGGLLDIDSVIAVQDSDERCALPSHRASQGPTRSLRYVPCN